MLKVAIVSALYLGTLLAGTAELAAATPSVQSAEPAQSAVTVKTLAGKRIMILGDSITQKGTYVTYIEYFLNKLNPTLQFDIISVGLASETASGLSEPEHLRNGFARPCIHERLQRALDEIKPQIVIACYGMNDGIYQPYTEERMDAFRKGITKLVETCRAAGAQVILVTPPVYEGGNYDEVLAKFAEWEVKTPPAGVLATADLHTRMAAALAERRKANPQFKFTTDKIHPATLGHIVMAQSILTELNIPMPEGTAEELEKSSVTDQMFGLIGTCREARSAAWLAYIGYNREKKVAPHTGDIAKCEATVKTLKAQIETLKK